MNSKYKKLMFFAGFFILSTTMIFSFPNFPSISWNGNSSTLLHEIGFANTQHASWAVNYNMTPGYLTYGPYTTDFQDGSYKVSFSLSVDNNVADDNVIGTVDVYDTISQKVLAIREFKRREFIAANVPQDFDVNFVTEGANRLEFRVRFYGHSYLEHWKTTVTKQGVIGLTSTFFGNQASMQHQLGSATTGNGWAAHSSEQEGFLSYGPYTSEYLAGPYTANFKLSVDNNTADNLNVATIDVFQNNTQKVLAQMVITRNQFTSPNTPQVFSVPFNHNGTGPLEFRVKVHGTSYVEHLSTDITSSRAFSYNANGGSMGHLFGNASGNAWETTVLDGPGFMSYGPYIKQIPVGAASAVFSLMIDNVTADNSTVLRLEAYDFISNKVLAYRIVKRKDFKTNYVTQEFDLNFELNALSTIELRVYSYGESFIKHLKTDVYPDRISMDAMWEGKAHFQPRTKNDHGLVSSLVVQDGKWYAFVREVAVRPGCTIAGTDRAFITSISTSTDKGVTWSPPVPVNDVDSNGPDACTITDGSAYFDAELDQWHMLFQCLSKTGGWNLCHYTRQGSDPVGKFVANTSNPVVVGGDLWSRICSGQGKACPTTMVDEGTPQIIKKVDNYFYVTFHGANYDGTPSITGARGIARTTDFVTYQVSGADLPGDAMISANDCNPWDINWKTGGCIGVGAANSIKSNGKYYMMVEAADLSLTCRPGQNWVFGLVRSNSLSKSGTWEHYPDNPYVVNQNVAPGGCGLQYMNFMRDRGEIFLHFGFLSSANQFPNLNFQLVHGESAKQLIMK